MRLVNSPLCSYCHLENETIVHLFSDCHVIKLLWNDLNAAYPNIELPSLTPKSAYFGFHPLKDSLINHIHLIFRIAVYKNRESETCSISYIKNKINSIKNLEENLTYLDANAMQLNHDKWSRFQ